MAYSTYPVTRVPARERLAYHIRILRVLSRTDFKLKYAGSVLGYVWSVAKPLMYFAVLWVVFSKLFRPGIHRFALYLIVGVVLWTFVADAVSGTLPSLVARGAILRRIAFPPIVIPVAATMTAAMTFAANCLVLVVFIAASRVVPTPKWLLLVPLVVELYLYALALSLILSTLYVRFRDVAHLWEVASTLLFFSAPIMYPITILPTWARPIVACNPFVQILQDARRLILGPDAHAIRLVGLHGNHVLPLAVLGVLIAMASVLYRREAPRFAELT